mmetsp:Transcript_18838/g.33204  ORF Transcript_18838/g.33204 Transcript_18838/m.33204 type:complete len:242 (+) Transcript_18838:44-769(+)
MPAPAKDLLVVVLSLILNSRIVVDSFSLTMATTSPSCRFVTNKMCPFAQKAWIALEAANANYKLEQVSLYGPGGKPDWFWKLNPKGEVPILVIDDSVVLADSDLILDEIGRVLDSSTSSPSPSNLVAPNSDDPKELHNTVQAFRECLREFLPIGKQAVLGGDKKKMWTKLQELDSLIKGPFVAGDQLTVADCAGFPFLWRIDNEFGDWEDHGCNNIPVWLKHCSQQPAFAKSIQRSWWWWW